MIFAPPTVRAALLQTGARVAMAFVAVVFVVFPPDVGASAVHGGGVAVSTIRINPTGIGPVRFGLPKRRAVTSLRSLFGAPTWRGENTGCGPRFTEVEWGDLVAEFRSKMFTGYRYAEGSYLHAIFGTRGVPSGTTPYPRLATSQGITLGSTLADLRQRYRRLRQSGAISWTTPDGLTFAISGKHQNVYAASNKIIEIKIGTCGAF